jgi:hypothetical protein
VDYVRESLLATGYLNVYRAARIILLQTLLALIIKATCHVDLSHVFEEMEVRKVQTEQNIHRMVNEISLSVSGVLNNMDEKSWSKRTSQDGKAVAGYVSMWPLNIALSAKTLSDQQKEQIFRQLNFIERRLWLGQALRIKER